MQSRAVPDYKFPVKEKPHDGASSVFNISLGYKMIGCRGYETKSLAAPHSHHVNLITGASLISTCGRKSRPDNKSNPAKMNVHQHLFERLIQCNAEGR